MEMEKKIQEKHVMMATHNLGTDAICVKFSLSGAAPRPSQAHAKDKEESSVETECMIQPMRNATTEIK